MKSQQSDKAVSDLSYDELHRLVHRGRELHDQAVFDALAYVFRLFLPGRVTGSGVVELSPAVSMGEK